MFINVIQSNLFVPLVIIYMITSCVIALILHIRYLVGSMVMDVKNRENCTFSLYKGKIFGNNVTKDDFINTNANVLLYVGVPSGTDLKYQIDNVYLFTFDDGVPILLRLFSKTAKYFLERYLEKHDVVIKGMYIRDNDEVIAFKQ